MKPAAVDETTTVGLAIVEGKPEPIRELHAAGGLRPLNAEVIGAAVDLLDNGQKVSQRAILPIVETAPHFDAVQWAQLGTVGTDALDAWTAAGAVRAFLADRRRRNHAEALRHALEILERGGAPEDYRAIILEELETEPETVAADPAAQFVRIGEIPIEPPEYLVKPLLERDCTAAVIGRPGSYKSFLALSVAASIATGTEWHGHRVIQGPALYIAAEGQGGIRRRVRAWEIVHGIELQEHPFLIRRRSAALTDPAAWPELKSKIDAATREVGPPLLIVLDTLAANFGPGHESDTGDMSAAMATVNRIRAAYGCAVLIVHHPSLADPRRARGSSVQVGALEHEYILEKDDTGTARLVTTKMKDGAEPDPLAFKFSTVELGIVDADGDPVTSGVLSRVDYTDPKHAPATGKNQKAALNVLHQEIERRRENLESAGVDTNGARVSVSEWADACKSVGLSRQAFYKVKKSLHENHQIQFDSEYVSPTASPVPEASPCPPSKEGGDKGRRTGEDQGDKGDKKETEKETERGHQGDTMEEPPEDQGWWDEHREDVF